MRSAILILALSAPVFACPDIDKAARAWLETNFPSDDEEKPVKIEQKIIRLTQNVSALQFSVPKGDEEKTAPPQTFTAFFSGTTACEFVQQWDGEIAETIEAGATKFILVRSEDAQEDEKHADFQVITVTPKGEVSATHDQHGQEIHFSQTIQNRCGENLVGDITSWKADSRDNRGITVRQRHTDRDARCRVTEDASSYRYYRMTPERWELDDSEGDTVAGEAELPPATAPIVHSRSPVLPRR